MKTPITCQLFLVILTQAATAEVIVDQEFKLPENTGINYMIDYPGDYLAQTFTVRNTGLLAGVGVQASVTARGQFVDDLHIRVTRIDEDGYPLPNEVLAAGSLAPDELPVAHYRSPATITDVDLSSWQVPVTAGDRLAILFRTDHTYYNPVDHRPIGGPMYAWFRQLHNPHPGGEYMDYSPQLYGPTPLRNIWLGGGDPTLDAGFRVYVDVIPEPSSLLLACGLFGCCWRR